VRALALAILLLGCNPDPAPAPAGSAARGSVASSAASAASGAPIANDAAAPKVPHKPLNVLLITIDSLRADMPWQGYDKAIAPNLTRLADESVVYTRAYSVSSYTSKSVGGLLAGRPPSTLYRGPTFFTRYTKANLFFPELLQEAGIHTLGGHAHLYFDRGKNLNQGFDVWRMTPGLKWNAETDESVTSHLMTPMAIEMMSDPKVVSGQFFMWLHYMDPHDKYVPHPESPKFGRKARNLYDAEVFYTDLHIQKLLEHCEQQPWWKDTALIISADHGEAFGEHDMWKHAFALWEVLTHVPLIIKVPGGKPRRIDARRSHFDLAPTIMELMGQKSPDAFMGKSMVPELYGLAEPDNREPILLDLPADTYNPNTRVVIKGDHKLIEDPGPKYKLFNLTEDPGERLNLAPNPKHAAILEEMKKVFDDAWAPYGHVAPYGGRKLVGGGKADGPMGPPGYSDPDDKKID
jgi:arylsulfatase A-like enzyme